MTHMQVIPSQQEHICVDFFGAHTHTHTSKALVLFDFILDEGAKDHSFFKTIISIRDNFTLILLFLS